MSEPLSLCALPGEMLAAMILFVDHVDLLQLEKSCRCLRATTVRFDSWQALAQREVLYYEDAAGERASAGWKRLVLLAQQPVRVDLSLLRQVRDCTSVDHSNESAENTLTRSHCGVKIANMEGTFVAQHPMRFQRMARRSQDECGCSHGHPCYWSSASTWSYATTDHLDYTLSESCLVNSVQVVPYRVFWYPGSPTYSPKKLSFELYELQDDGGIGPLVYESMVFSIVKDMQMQVFELPQRVFLRRGIMRLNLFGRQEDIGEDVVQWMQENNLPPYYTCLSYVGATGLIEPTSTAPSA